jgi:ABC-type antimicrobial peptide transport system permease subunit
MVLGQGMAVALVGLLVGLLGALASGRAIAGLLYGVRPSDPVLLLLVGVVLLLVAGTASWAPALRATTVDPATVLSSE